MSDEQQPQPQMDQRVGAALWNIRIDAATAEVVEAFAAVGVNSIVLKGPALSDWYPTNFVRVYVDGDLWVSPADQEMAGKVLTSLGFLPRTDESGLPDWWQEHASSWWRELDRGSIDLHRKLQGVKADPARVWKRLWAQAEDTEVAGRAVRRLSPAARVLYVTLHAAHDGDSGVKSQMHLQVALASAGEAAWSDAAALAVELDAVDAFGAGLRLVPAGRELAERLEVPANRSVETAIRAATAPPVALGFEQLASSHGVRRLEILARKVFPPPGFIRHWWPPAARSRRMLMAGYMYRPVWLLQHAPSGYRAWRAARRHIKSQDRPESNSR